MFRRGVLIRGLLTSLAGVVGVSYAVFGPTQRWERVEIREDGTVREQSGTSNLLDEGLEPGTIAFLVAVVALAVLVALGAYLLTVRRQRLGLLLVLFSSAQLIGATIITVFSIGALLAPSALLGMLTSAAAGLQVWLEGAADRNARPGATPGTRPS